MCSRRDVWICCGVMWRVTFNVTFTVTFSWTTTWCCITSCDGSDWLELMVHKFRLMPHQIVIDVVFVIWCLIKYTFFVCTSVKMKVIYLVVLVIYIHVKIIQQYFLSSITIFGYEVWINVYKKISGGHLSVFLQDTCGLIIAFIIMIVQMNSLLVFLWLHASQTIFFPE